MPTGLATTSGHESILLTWDTADPNVTTLRIQRDTLEVAEIPATETSWLDSGLVVGRTYSYTMTAVDKGGRVSPVSAPVEGVPLDLMPPPVPVDVVATAGDTLVTVGWTAVVDPHLAGYRVYVDGVHVHDVPGDTTSATITSLTNGREYSFAVTSADEAGNESALSAAASATPEDRTPPPTPTGLAAEAGDSRITLRWDPVVDAGLAGYRLYEGDNLVTELDPATTSTVVEGLANDVALVYSVSAFDDWDNESPRSPGVEAIPRDMTPPGVPENPAAEAGDGEATLRWDPVVAGDLAGYRVYVDGQAVQDVAAGTTTATVTGLTNGREHQLAVSSLDLAGNESEVSAAVAVTPVDLTPPPVPLLVSVEPGDEAATATWEPVDAPDLAAYRVFVDGALAVEVPAGTVTATVEGLTNGQPYEVSVSSVDAAGNESEASLSLSVRPEDRTPPPVPTGLAGSGSDQRVTLSWEPVSAPDLAGYRLYLDGVVMREVTAEFTTTDIWDLVNGHEYQATVTSFDALGNESTASEPVTVAPVDDVAPPAPTGLAAWAGDGFVTISWTASDATDVAGYRIHRDGVEVGLVDGLSTQYRDDTVEGTHSFTVTAFDHAGNESEHSAVVQGAPATPLVMDDFNRPDGPIGSTPGTNLRWTGGEGGPTGWRVTSERATGQSSITWVPVVVDAGVSDGTVGVTLTDWTYIGSNVGVVFRGSDGGNHWRAERIYENTSDCGVGVALVRKVQGQDRVMAKACNVAVERGSRLVASMSGSTIKVLLDGTEIIEFIDTFNATATRHGMAARSDEALDDFQISGPGDDIAPTRPTGVTIVNGDGQAATSWQAVGDNDVAGYRVYRDGRLTAEVGAHTTAHTVTGLTAGTTYVITVTAFDVYGNESPHSLPVTTTPGQQVVFDDFNRLDGTIGFAPVSGLTWTGGEGGPTGWRVASGRATGQSSITWVPVVVDAGVSDGTVGVTLTDWTFIGSNVGVVFRASDGGNHWRAERGYFGTECGVGLALVRRVAGQDRTMARVCNVAVERGSRLVASMSGSTIKVLLDGTEIIEFVDTFNATATRHGMAARSDEALDDFEVTTAP